MAADQSPLAATTTREADGHGTSAPVIAGRDERALVVGATTAVAVVGLPAGSIAYLVAGWNGAASAVIGLVFVWVLFAGSALLLVRAARQHRAGIALLVVGAAVRLVLYLVVLILLSQLSWVHGRSLALATAAAVAVTLAYELWLIARSPRMFWIDPEAVRPSAVSNATRS